MNLLLLLLAAGVPAGLGAGEDGVVDVLLPLPPGLLTLTVPRALLPRPHPRRCRRRGAALCYQLTRLTPRSGDRRGVELDGVAGVAVGVAEAAAQLHPGGRQWTSTTL